MPARLTIFLPDRPARVHALEAADESVLGRDDGCVVHLDDDRVSRRHASIRCREGQWLLADLHSKNGTQVDGAPVHGPVALGETSWISLGGLLARFDLVSGEAAARGAAAQLRRWQSSLEMQRQLTPSRGLPALLERLLDSVLGLSATERAFVLLADEAGELTLAATRGVDSAAIGGREFAGSVGAVERALAERRTVATSDAQVDPRLAARASVAESSIRALLCVPLQALDRVIGALYADSTQPGKTFTELDVEILEGLAGHAALAITVVRLDAELAGMAAALPDRAGALSNVADAGGARSARRAPGAAPGTPASAPRWRDLRLAHGGAGVTRESA